MQIFKDSITSLAREGRLTLQVPNMIISFGPAAPGPQYINAPDEWFCFLKNDTPCVGKQQGYLYLTEKGFNDNYDDLKKAFEDAIARGYDRTNGVGWPAFVQHAADHFAEVKSRQAKLIAKKQKEIAELQAFVV